MSEPAKYATTQTNLDYVIPVTFCSNFLVCMVWLVGRSAVESQSGVWRATGGFKLLLVSGMIVCKPFFKHFLAWCLWWSHHYRDGAGESPRQMVWHKHVYKAASGKLCICMSLPRQWHGINC